MSDTHTTNLCSQIIREHFGPITAKVASVLLSRGRLNLPNLVRFTSLKSRLVRASVLILIQHNIIRHSLADEEEILEFDSEECLLRLRFGRYVRQAEASFGAEASEVVALVLDHGKLRSPDIISHFTPGKNPIRCKEALKQLVAANYLIPTSILFHISARDKLLQYEKEEKLKIKNIPTSRELREARERAETRLKQERDDDLKLGLIKTKAAKTNGAKVSHKHEVENVIVNEETYFRVNASKFNIHIRNKLVEQAVEERFNRPAAVVMRAALKATEARTTMSDIRSDGVSLNSVATYIPEGEDIVPGLVFKTPRKPTKMQALNEYIGILSASDNPTPAGRISSFMSSSGSGSSKVFIEFEIICQRLRRRVLEAVARERYGDEAVRIIRLLLQHGKMSGDQVAKYAMMATTTVRTLLSLLSADSLISIQEVPKGADRNPQRTIYLWYVDLPKAYSVLLGHFYKTLYNIGVRRQAEGENPAVKVVLEKSERSDVREDPSLLNRTEQETLRSLKERRDKLTLLEMRVEEAVFILRDLAALGSDLD